MKYICIVNYMLVGGWLELRMFVALAFNTRALGVFDWSTS
jgi:hypothetical protein